MHKLISLAMAALLASAPTPAALPGAEPVSIEHVTLIDGTGAPPQEDVTVVVRSGRISEIAKSASVKPPANARRVNGGGRFLIPGLWDMHVHLSLAGESALSQVVAYGICGVRDLGSDVWELRQWRDEIAKGSRVGPTIFLAGPLVDGEKPGAPHRLTVHNAEEARCAVRTLQTGLGVDLIKVHSALSREAFFALARETRARGIPLACHLPESVTAEEASDAGCKSLEHMAETLLAGFRYLPKNPARSPEEAAERLVSAPGVSLFRILARNGTWVDPTLAGYLDFVKMGRDPEEVAARQAIFEKLQKAVGLLRDAKVRLLAGSDFSDPDPRLKPGESLHDELALLVRSGLKPLEAIRTATRDSAEYLGLLDQRGTVEKGKVADLVLLEADPLANISSSRRITAVLIGGRLFEGPDLQRLRNLGSR